MIQYRKNSRIRTVLILAMVAGGVQHADKNWLMYADYKLPHVELRYESNDSNTVDLIADLQELADLKLDHVDLVHFVVQLNWGNSKSGMLMLVLDVFAKDKDQRDQMVDEYIRKYLPGFNGARFLKAGGFPVDIPKAGWAHFRQVVIQADDVEDLSRYASRVERY